MFSLGKPVFGFSFKTFRKCCKIPAVVQRGSVFSWECSSTAESTPEKLANVLFFFLFWHILLQQYEKLRLLLSPPASPSYQPGISGLRHRCSSCQAEKEQCHCFQAGCRAAPDVSFALSAWIFVEEVASMLN